LNSESPTCQAFCPPVEQLPSPFCFQFMSACIGSHVLCPAGTLLFMFPW
jgi:hypothetical protein